MQVAIPQKCKKRCFDEITAKLTLARIQHTDNPKRPRMEQRAYRHEYAAGGCGWWHLTSMPRGH